MKYFDQAKKLFKKYRGPFLLVIGISVIVGIIIASVAS